MTAASCAMAGSIKGYNQKSERTRQTPTLYRRLDVKMGVEYESIACESSFNPPNNINYFVYLILGVSQIDESDSGPLLPVFGLTPISHMHAKG